MELKIAHFIPSMNDGGAESLVRDYSMELKQRGFDSIVITYIFSKNSANERKVLENGIKLICLTKPGNSFFRRVLKIFDKWFLPLKLKRILEKQGVNVLHAHLNCLPLVARISSFLSKKGIAVFYTCHSEPEKTLPHRSSHFKACKHLLERNNMTLIALHDEMKKKLNLMFRINSTIVVNNGIDFSRFKKTESSEQKRLELGISNDAYVIGHVGRFDSMKNHRFIIDVFLNCLRKKSDCVLLLVGSGRLLFEIKNMVHEQNIDNKVIFLSHRKDVPDLLSIMDVFVFPSLYEGVSISLIEAQIAGVPCVVSDRINTDTFCTNLITVLSLDTPSERWADCLLTPSPNFRPQRNIKEFDIKDATEKLISLYKRGLTVGQ